MSRKQDELCSEKGTEVIESDVAGINFYVVSFAEKDRKSHNETLKRIAEKAGSRLASRYVRRRKYIK